MKLLEEGPRLIFRGSTIAAGLARGIRESELSAPLTTVVFTPSSANGVVDVKSAAGAVAEVAACQMETITMQGETLSMPMAPPSILTYGEDVLNPIDS